MLQIIIWLGAVYLVFKGQEIQQIAAASTHENRDENLKRAKMWSAFAWVAAALFVVLSLAQGSAVPSPPRF
jgi:hypothetical protein